MEENKVKKYKPNNVYVLEIHGCQYYVGCHSWQKEMTSREILFDSGNYLRVAYNEKLITTQEYKECCQVILIEEYSSKEEAEIREAELIADYKKKYGALCLNQCKGNKYSCQGLVRSKETRRKISESRKGIVFSEEHRRNISKAKTGIVYSEETRQKISKAELNHPKKSKPILQFTLDDQFVAEYPSIGEAARQTGINRGNISLCCLGVRKNAGNSKWQYKTTN